MKWYQRGSPREHVMIWHTDTNKSFRCPRRCTQECGGYVDGEEATGRYFTAWRVHSCCDCGLKVIRNPLFPGYPGAGDGYAGRVRWLVRRNGMDLRYWLTDYTWSEKKITFRRLRRKLHR